MGGLAGVGRRRIDRILIVVKFGWRSALGPQRRLVSLVERAGSRGPTAMVLMMRMRMRMQLRISQPAAAAEMKKEEELKGGRCVRGCVSMRKEQARSSLGEGPCKGTGRGR
jgi:hypothetical protein